MKKEWKPSGFFLSEASPGCGEIECKARKISENDIKVALMKCLRQHADAHGVDRVDPPGLAVPPGPPNVGSSGNAGSTGQPPR